MAVSVENGSIGGEALGGHSRRARVFPKGRTCAEEGCHTVLSVYNSRTHCSLHDFDASLEHVRASSDKRSPSQRTTHGRRPSRQAA